MTLHLDIPVLETERLRMRLPCEADVTPEAAFMATEASQYIGGPAEHYQVWRGTAQLIGHWVMRGYGFWGVEDKHTGDYIGHVGLWFPYDWPEPEIGWTLMPHAQGKGYATEAALAARAHAYDVLGWTTAISLIHPDNHPSKAVAKRLGATLETTFEHPKYGTTEIWRHLPPEEVTQETDEGHP